MNDKDLCHAGNGPVQARTKLVRSKPLLYLTQAFSGPT